MTQPPLRKPFHKADRPGLRSVVAAVWRAIDAELLSLSTVLPNRSMSAPCACEDRIPWSGRHLGREFRAAVACAAALAATVLGRALRPTLMALRPWSAPGQDAPLRVRTGMRLDAATCNPVRAQAWLLVAVLFVASSPAAAREVVVRAGEHADFTRLVLNLPAGATWRLNPGADAAELELAPAGHGFDLAATFSRIPRTRLRDARMTEAGNLRLELACECPIRVFEDLPGLLVVDLLDPPASSAPPPAASPHGDPAAAAGRALAETLRQRARAEDPEAAEDALLEARLTQDLGLSLLASLRGFAEGAAQPVATDLGWQPGGHGHTPPPPAFDPHPIDTQPLAAGSAPAAASGDLLAQIRIGGLDDPGPRPDPHCLPAQALALDSWGDPRPFTAQIAAARGRLLGEFDRPDSQAISALARLYLHFGFGAEARAALQAFPVAIEDADLLRALSYIVDDTLPAAPGRLPGQARCAGPGPLWALLSAPVGVDLPGLDVGWVRRAFSDLPRHQRRSLGPAVVTRLLARGEIEAARVTGEAARRAALGPDGVAPLDLALARVAMAESADRPDRLPPPLPAATQSPEALVLVLETMVARGEIPDRALAEAAGVLAVEHRTTPLAGDLLRAQALALAAAGAFPEAFAAADIFAGAAPDAALRLRLDLYETLMREGSDARFVEAIFTQRPWDGPVLSEPLRLALGTRLSQLGFDAHAQLLLQGDHPASLIDAAAPAPAQNATLEGPELDMLRTPQGASVRAPGSSAGTVAARGTGEAAAPRIQSAAGEAPAEATAPAPALSVGRVSGPGIAPADTGAPEGLAAATRALPEQTPDPAMSFQEGGLLAQSRAAIAESAALRERIATLLAASRQP